MNPKIKRWWYNWRLPIIAAILLLIGWNGRGPVLRLAAGWRAAGAVTKATEYADSGKWKAAEAEARRALQLERNRLDAMRVLLTAALVNRSGDALRIAAAVFTHPESEPSDKAKSLELLLLSRDFLGFARLQSLLSPQLRLQPDIFLQTTRFLSLRGGEMQALAQLRQYLAGKDIEDERFQLLEADLLLRAQQYAAARNSILGVIRERSDDDKIALTAFRMLEQLPARELRQLDSNDLADWIASSPNSTTRDHFLLASIQISGIDDPVSRSREIDEVITRHQEKNPAALGDWLFQIGQGGRVRDVIDEEVGKQSAKLFELRLRGFLVGKDYKEADKWLATAGALLDPVQVSAMRAVIAKKRGHDAAAVKLWMSAMHEGSIRANGNLFLKIGFTALDFQEWDWAIEAILEASAFPETLLPPATDLTVLIDYLLRQDRVSKAIELTRYWLAREPENPVLRNNFLYLKMLAGEPVKNTIDQTTALKRLFPGMIGFHTTHALALALQGQKQEAEAILADSNLSWERATASDQAIRQRLLGITKPGTEGRAGLYPVEQRLLASSTLPDYSLQMDHSSDGKP